MALELLRHTPRVVDKETEEGRPLGRSVAVEDGAEPLGAPGDTPRRRLNSSWRAARGALGERTETGFSSGYRAGELARNR